MYEKGTGGQNGGAGVGSCEEVKRKGGDGLGEGIEMGEWNGHFRELLERRVIMGTGEGLREDGEEWLGRVEIKKTLGKIGVIRCQN